MSYVATPGPTFNPSWTDRNKVIGSQILSNTNVLDLGCGHKDLLKYITPKKYIGLDHNDVADVFVNFNLDFNLPDGPWDYIVCSGLLEYLTEVPSFVEKIKNHSKQYIITYWGKNHKLRGPNNLPEFSVKDFEILVNKHFKVVTHQVWKNHYIFVLEDKK